MTEIISSKVVGTMRDLREHRVPSLAFKDYCDRARARHGDQFDDSTLAEKFRPFFRTGTRIKVRFSHGLVKTGTVGASTGWRPIFLLMLRRNSSGSPWTLSDKDEIIGVQKANGRGYRELSKEHAA